MNLGVSKKTAGGADAQARSMRIQIAVLLAAMIVLALGSFWVLQAMRTGTHDDVHAAASGKADYYVDNFVYVKMALDGSPRYSITGKRMEHYPADDSFKVQTPFIRSLDKAKPPMQLRSDRAMIEDDNSKIHMLGNAYAERDPVGKSPKLTVNSDYLLLLPDDDKVTTDRPVRIMLGDSVLNGVGMVASNAELKLELQNRVHGIYYAKPR
ncbi:LPS export ABC transporter periplasmic protein LptC [Oxalobacteraceae bacterium CAVE-383]|nr:LPS export ABC transporter periplasmic protein LptC [Oxalobacteraceae bacterium CAVE-383]